MKIRLMLALAGIAIGFILPTFAQQKDTVDVTPHGAFTGRAAIEKKYEEEDFGNTMAATWSVRPNE